MYRLSGPKNIIFIPLLLLAIFLVALLPNYFVQFRIMSFVSLLIGQLALSFLPVIILYPKATIFQATVLAIIYFLVALLICSGAWGINSLGWPGTHSFIIRETDVSINKYALFLSNFFSLIIIFLNFKLFYDEDLKKHIRNRSPDKKPFFETTRSTILSRPDFQDTTKDFTTSKSVKPSPKIKEGDFSEEYWEPFEFESAETNISPENLPEESSGGLQVKKEINKESKQITHLPPSNIKEELDEIFEQYASLDAVKKITSTKQTQKKKLEKEAKTVNEEEVFEASFRPVSEAEKIEEIKESLKEELIKSLKSEIQKETTLSKQPEDTELIKYKEKISLLNKKLSENLKDYNHLKALQYLDLKGTVLSDITLQESSYIDKNLNISLANFYSHTSNQLIKTKQGNLLHLLLESENEVFLIANEENTMLTIKSKETSEEHIGNLLNVLSEVQEG